MNTAPITNPKLFEGGNLTFTVHNDVGKHYTFRIRKPGPCRPFFLSLMTGSDNETNYTYMGIYNPIMGNVKLTKKSKYGEESVPLNVARWAIQKVRANKILPDGYKILHSGNCCRCGRKLTVPTSIEAGIGPSCAAGGF